MVAAGVPSNNNCEGMGISNGTFPTPTTTTETGVILNGSDIMQEIKTEEGKVIHKKEHHDPDFEYHVEFPKVDGNKFETIWPLSSGKLDSNDNDKEKVVVVLLGWAGAQDKHLAKYSDLYLSRGCIIVRYTAPGKVVMFDHEQLPRLTSKLIRMLKDLELDSHPMFFHMFSNGGGFTYSYMLAELATQNIYLDIRGTIFDSAPAPREIGSYFKALLNIFESYNGFRYLMAGVMVVMLVLSIFWSHMKSAIRFCVHGDTIGVDKGRPTHNWLSRISQYRNHSFLFIYSDADDIILTHHIEKFAKFVEEHDNSVKYLKFKDSLHVQHYRKYPKEYVGTITQFIREVMKEETNPTQFPTQY